VKRPIATSLQPFGVSLFGAIGSQLDPFVGGDGTNRL